MGANTQRIPDERREDIRRHQESGGKADREKQSHEEKGDRRRGGGPGKSRYVDPAEAAWNAFRNLSPPIHPLPI